MAEEIDGEADLEIRWARSAAGWDRLWRWLLTELPDYPDSRNEVAGREFKRLGEAQVLDAPSVDEPLRSGRLEDGEDGNDSER